MRKFLIAALLGTLSLTAPLSDNNLIHAEEIQQEEIVTFESTVTISSQKGGEILVDLTEVHVGDKVTAHVSPYVLYKIETVSVNGVNLTANEDGNYEFLLVEGENIITATFVVDNEELTSIANLLADAKDGEWDEIFTMSNLVQAIYWLLTTIFTSGFFITLLKTKKIKAETTKEIKSAVEAILSSKLGDSINTFLEATIVPLFEQYNIKINYTEETCKVLARCFALAQENTPEARLAIINELTKFKNTEQDLNEEVKKIINEEIERNNAEKAQLNKTIEELKEANQKVVTPVSEEDTYGQI